MRKIILAPFLALFLILQCNLSYALEWKRLHEEADKRDLAAAARAVDKYPGSKDELYISGLVYLNAHKDKDAGRAFDEVLRLDPACVEARWGKSEVLRRQHDYKKSEELINQVLKEKPDFWPAYITLAYIRYIQMDFNQAVRLANKVLEQGEDNVDRSNHVRAHLIAGGSKGMIAHYGGVLSKLINGTAVLPNIRKAEKLQPDSPGVVFGLGSFYLLAPKLAGGSLDKAEGYLKRTIEIDPLFVDAYVRLGQLYRIKGDNAKYEFYLNKALEIDPRNEVALDIKSGACKFICVSQE